VQRSAQAAARGVAEKRDQDRFDVGRCQPLQAQRGVRGAPRDEITGVKIGPVGDQHHQRTLIEPVGHRAQRFERRRVCPLQILDHQQQRCLAQAVFEHRA